LPKVTHLEAHIIQIRITIQIISGLQFIHSQGVLHRDLKTDNVLLDCSGLLPSGPLDATDDFAAHAEALCTGTPFLSDFGHAENGRRASSLSASLRFEGSGRAGSLLWLAPEILAGACS
jgi:serine/threonine protein kinase